MSSSVQRYHKYLSNLLDEYIKLKLKDEAVSTLALLTVVDKFPKHEKVVELATLIHTIQDLKDEYLKEKNLKGEHAVKLSLTIQKKQYEHKVIFQYIESTAAYQVAFKRSPSNVALRILCPEMPPPLPRLQ
jgi:hypothetical protein